MSGEGKGELKSAKLVEGMSNNQKIPWLTYVIYNERLVECE